MNRNQKRLKSTSSAEALFWFGSRAVLGTRLHLAEFLSAAPRFLPWLRGEKALTLCAIFAVSSSSNPRAHPALLHHSSVESDQEAIKPALAFTSPTTARPPCGTCLRLGVRQVGADGARVSLLSIPARERARAESGGSQLGEKGGGGAPSLATREAAKKRAPAKPWSTD